MRLFWRVGAVALSLLVISTSQAAVTLGFTNGSQITPTSATVFTSQPFQVNVILTTTANEVVTGTDYQVNVSAAGSGLIQLNGRDISTSRFTVYNAVADGDSSFFPKKLSPANGFDLGAVAASRSADITTSNTYLIATLTFQALAAAATLPPTTYTLGFVPSTNTTYYEGAANNFPQKSFDSEGSYSITVVAPEPASLALLGLLVPAAMLRRRSV